MQEIVQQKGELGVTGIRINDKDINQVLQTSGTDIRIILDKNSIKMKYSKQTLKLHVSVIVKHIFEALRLQKSD